MSTDIPLQKLLRSAFNGDEWRYLSHHKVFREQIKKQPKTTEGYERLVEIGSLLLKQREDFKRKN